MYATQLYKSGQDDFPDMTIAAPLYSYPLAYQFLRGKRLSTSISETLYLKVSNISAAEENNEYLVFNAFFI